MTWSGCDFSDPVRGKVRQYFVRITDLPVDRHKVRHEVPAGKSGNEASSFRAVQLYNAHCQPVRLTIHYRFRPYFDTQVEPVSRRPSPGGVNLCVPLPDGCPLTIGEWLNRPEARMLAVRTTPGFAREALSKLRRVVDDVLQSATVDGRIRHEAARERSGRGNCSTRRPAGRPRAAKRGATARRSRECRGSSILPTGHSAVASRPRDAAHIRWRNFLPVHTRTSAPRCPAGNPTILKRSAAALNAASVSSRGR